MRIIIPAGLAAAAFCPTSAIAAKSVPYAGWFERSQYIRSYDGTRIAVTVRRPMRSGQPVKERLPVIVTQDRSDGNPDDMRRFTNAGYIWVSQDRRGTGASFGIQTGFVNQADARDAKAVIDWAAAQPFSSGKVVATGCSNQGAWQYLVATLRPRALVAIAPACASPQFFDHGVSMNGIPMMAIGVKPYAGECARPASGARPVGFVPPAPRPVDEDKDGQQLKAAVAGQKCGAAMLGQYWRNMARDEFNQFAGYRPAIEDSAMTHWQAIKASKIAVLQLGGWYDAAVAGQLEGQRLWGGRLVMGPWVHGNQPGRGANAPAADFDLDGEILRWFDTHAKNAGRISKPSIRYYTANAPAGQEWREVARWPTYPMRNYFLKADGMLSSSPPEQNGEAADYAQQDVRWFDGQYSPLGRWWNGDMNASDALSLSHTLAPLSVDMEVTGTPSAKLWIAANAPDANLFAVLEDVAPDGKSTYVSDGRIRASWRAIAMPPWGRSPQAWHSGYLADLKPLGHGEASELVFDFFPISYVFKAGHRIRVSIATSIGQRYQDPPMAEGKPVRLTVYRDARHPSQIVLPVAPQHR